MEQKKKQRQHQFRLESCYCVCVLISLFCSVHFIKEMNKINSTSQFHLFYDGGGGDEMNEKTKTK